MVGNESPHSGAEGAGVGGASLSTTKVQNEGRTPRARTLEVIAETIRWMIANDAKSCLWVTVTFPESLVGYVARQFAMNAYRRGVLMRRGLSIWVPEPHLSGAIHYHGVWSLPGQDFETGFDHGARNRWTKGRGEADKKLWIGSGNEALKALWKERKEWRERFGLGWIDIVPLWPGTIPIAVGRYMAAYAGKGEHPKGTRMVRRIGFKNHVWEHMGETQVGVELPLKANQFSRVGERSTVFGRLKMAGDDGPGKQFVRLRECEECGRRIGFVHHLPFEEDAKRRKGWALRAVIRGAGRVNLAAQAWEMETVNEVLLGAIKSARGEWTGEQLDGAVEAAKRGEFESYERHQNYLDSCRDSYATD